MQEYKFYNYALNYKINDKHYYVNSLNDCIISLDEN